MERLCRRVLLGMVTMVGAALWGQAGAVTPSTPDSIETQSLGEVMVTANRYSEVIPSQKLSGKELQGASRDQQGLMVQDPDNDRQDGGYIKQVIEGSIEPVSADLISLVVLLRGDE